MTHPNQLRPCPFCGAEGDDHLFISVSGSELEPSRNVYCAACATQGPMQDEDTKSAEDLWNDRP